MNGIQETLHSLKKIQRTRRTTITKDFLESDIDMTNEWTSLDESPRTRKCNCCSNKSGVINDAQRSLISPTVEKMKEKEQVPLWVLI